MLYLNPPFHFIDGLSLLPDHADPLQWYYLPMAPHLTTSPDAVTGQELPSLQLLLFRGAVAHEGETEVPTGGFINLDVNLGVSQKTLDDLRGKLQAQANLREAPRLAPVPVIDGSVRLLLLGKESEALVPGQAPHPPPPGGSERFVVKISSGAKPSLYGDEQAAFSVELTQDGAVALSQALDGAITPIGIVYSLDYVALRPAYTVTLRVHWDRVQEQLDERFGYSGIFVSAEIDDMVDKLIEKRDIELDATLLVPGGPDSGTTETDFAKAKAEVREMITSAFFTPSIEPSHAAPDGWDKAAGLADRISQLAVTGGLSSLGSFSYNKTHYTRIDKKSLDVTMNERSAVRRSIWPQGHLSGISSLVRQSGLPKDRFITWIDLDADFFKRRAVKLNPVGFTTDAHMLSVAVDLTYGSDTHSVTFAPGSAASQSVEWASVLDGNEKMVKDVEYRYTVGFEDQPGLSRPRTLGTPAKSTTADAIEVFPPDDIPYWLTPIPVTHLQVPWDRWEAVDVDLRYEDPAHQVSAEYHQSITANVSPPSWSMFRLDEDKRTFQARFTYRGKADRQDHVVDWHEIDEEQVKVGNPFGGRTRRIQVVPPATWTAISRVFVDLDYEDPANQVSYRSSLSFDSQHTDPQDFLVDLRDPNVRRVTYDVTFLYIDGRQLTVPTSATTKDRLIVDEAMRGTQIVVVRAGEGEFVDKGLDVINVSLRHVDATTGSDISSDVRLTQDSRWDTFEFPFTDEQAKIYSYALKYRYSSGLIQSIDPVSTADDLLVVAVK